MGHLPVAVDHLVLGQRRATSRAPRHRTVAFVEPASFLADLQDVPDVRDVQVAVGEVRVRPVHPLAHADRALGDGGGRTVHTRSARVGELADPVRLDVALAVEIQLTLDLHLDPETLAIEAVLVTLIEAAHRLVALVDVLIGTGPGAVNAHAFHVRGDRTVEERKPRAARVLLAEHLEGVLALPEVKDPVVDLGEVELRADRTESRSFACLGHRSTSFYKQKRRPDVSGRREPWYHPS